MIMKNDELYEKANVMMSKILQSYLDDAVTFCLRTFDQFPKEELQIIFHSRVRRKEGGKDYKLKFEITPYEDD